MNSRHAFRGCLVAALVTLGTNIDSDQAVAAQQVRAELEEGIQVLTRGPVHEAFAETVTFDPQPGIVVPKSPPDSIEELPPELPRPWSNGLMSAYLSWIKILK